MKKTAKDKLIKIKNRIYDFFNILFFPKGLTCINCGEELQAETRYDFCSKCFSELPIIAERKCLICGTEILNEAEICDNCCRYDHYFEKNRAPFRYEGIVASLIKKLKYGNKKYIADELAKIMCDTYVNEGYDCDEITFVPMTSTDERKRGYNQSRLLAEKISERLNLPLSEVLVKLRETSMQKELNAKTRRENLKGAFAVNNGEKIKGKVILLIDDVFTTGATVNECARVLRRAGARQVYSLTVCVTKFKIEGETVAR